MTEADLARPGEMPAYARKAVRLVRMPVHRYFEINAGQLVATVNGDVPSLVPRLEQLLGEPPIP